MVFCSKIRQITVYDGDASGEDDLLTLTCVIVMCLAAEDVFDTYYRMSYEQFCTLRELMHPHISINEMQTRRRSLRKDQICIEIFITIGLRYLAGGSYSDIRLVCRVGNSSFYRCFTSF